MVEPVARIFLTELQTGDSDFPLQCCSWAWQTKNDIAELVASTQKTLADSHAIIAEIDRLLAQRYTAVLKGDAI